MTPSIEEYQKAKQAAVAANRNLKELEDAINAGRLFTSVMGYGSSIRVQCPGFDTVYFTHNQAEKMAREIFSLLGITV